MTIVKQNPQKFNYQGDSSPEVLALVDSSEVMAAHYQDRALLMSTSTRWHQGRTEALTAERRALAADVGATWTEAKRLLQ